MAGAHVQIQMTPSGATLAQQLEPSTPDDLAELIPRDARSRAFLLDADASSARAPLTFERLECPSLRELRCSELGGYGNGLVPRDPTCTGSGDWWWERPGPGVCDQPCKFTRTRWGQQSDSPLIDLPEQCVVYWSGSNFGQNQEEIRATSSTTYGELYDCTGPLQV